MEYGRHRIVDQKLKECNLFVQMKINEDKRSEEVVIYCLMMMLRLAIIILDGKGMETMVSELNKYKVVTPESLVLKAKSFAIRNEWKSFRTIMNKLREESKKNGKYLENIEKDFEEIMMMERDYDIFQEEKKREKLIGQFGKIYSGFLSEMEKIKRCFVAHNFNEAIDLCSKLWFKLITLDDPVYKSTKITVLLLIVESKM
jgi:hypothetical protein